MKILVVDDDPVSRKMLQKIMSSFGECEEVENGKAAIKSFEQAWANFTPSFDLITLDIRMPEMDGTEVLNRIRELEIKKEIPLEKRVKISRRIWLQNDKKLL
jgi:two-component system chemotaxis response regulator CheY